MSYVPRVRYGRWVVGALLVAGCKQQPHQVGVADADASARLSASSVVAPVAPLALVDAEHSVDLLHRTAAVVVTSSHRDGSSTAAYLVDELPETSWQPNTPDPQPWIEVDLPAPAVIERIELVFAPAPTPPPKPWPLPPQVQVQVPAAGGRWKKYPARGSLGAQGQHVLEPEAAEKLSRLRVAFAPMPRSLRVAELLVIGGIERKHVLPPAVPETQVQGNPRIDYTGAFFTPWVLGAPYPTEDALCQAFRRALGITPEGDQPTGDVCRKLPDVAVTGSVPPEIRAVQTYQLSTADEVSPAQTTALVVRTDRGLFPANLAVKDERNDGLCPGDPEAGMRVSNFRFDQGVLLMDRERFYQPGSPVTAMPALGPPVAAASVLRCRLEERLLCRELMTSFGKPVIVLDQNGTPQLPQMPTVWDWTRTVTVSQRGSLRFSPCRTPDSKHHPSRVVPCATPGTEVL